MIKDLDKKYKYVVACSFGPDSMALLDMLIKEEFDIVVAHVNYHKRDISNFEEQQLRKFCSNQNIPIEVLDTTGLICTKNFQEWAREIRYKFFQKVLVKYKAKAVVVAHQEDDLIETFLMQEKRGGLVKYCGIAEKTTVFNVDVIRPLLSFTKQDLLDYDKQNNVPFSIDISNLGDAYERNRVRHTVVENMARGERDAILNKIHELNLHHNFETKKKWEIEEFLSLSDKQIVFSLSNYLDKTEHVNLSSGFISEIRKAIKSKKPYLKIALTKKIGLIKDYDLVYFSDQNFVRKYCYKIEENTVVDDDLFTIDFTFGKNERNIEKSDYPLTIKPISRVERIVIDGFDYSVKRFFIDTKMPHRFRAFWPGIYNKNGKLIYTPRYRKEFVDNHISKFVIKFTK